VYCSRINGYGTCLYIIFMKFNAFVLFIVLTISSFSVSAKKFNPYGSDWSVGIHFGGTAFFGDIKSGYSGLNSTPFSKYFYKDSRFMGGISLDKWFNPYVGVIGNIQYGQVQGTKEENNKWFEAKYFEYNLALMVNISNTFFGVNNRRKHLVYYTIGVGMSESRSWMYNLESGALIGTNGNGIPRHEGGATRPMTEGVAMSALGVKFFIGGNLTLSFEGSVHAINSDKLDTKVYDNKSFLARLEGYNYFNVGLQYNFGNNGRYSTIRYRHKSRYSGGRGSWTEINTKRYSKKRKKLLKKRKKQHKFSKR